MIRERKEHKELPSAIKSELPHPRVNLLAKIGKLGNFIFSESKINLG